ISRWRRSRPGGRARVVAWSGTTPTGSTTGDEPPLPGHAGRLDPGPLLAGDAGRPRGRPRPGGLGRRRGGPPGRPASPGDLPHGPLARPASGADRLGWAARRADPAPGCPSRHDMGLPPVVLLTPALRRVLPDRQRGLPRRRLVRGRGGAGDPLRHGSPRWTL